MAWLYPTLAASPHPPSPELFERDPALKCLPKWAQDKAAGTGGDCGAECLLAPESSYGHVGAVWSKVLTAQERETHIWTGKLPMTNISSALKIFLKAPCELKLMLLWAMTPR